MTRENHETQISVSLNKVLLEPSNAVLLLLSMATLHYISRVHDMVVTETMCPAKPKIYITLFLQKSLLTPTLERGSVQ